MSQVAAAARAEHLGPDHPVACVRLLLDRAGRRRERRPTAAGVVLRIGVEELRPAAGADVGARLERVVVLAAERALRALLPEHAVLLVGELLPPLGVGLLDLRHAYSVRALKVSQSCGAPRL